MTDNAKTTLRQLVFGDGAASVSLTEILVRELNMLPLFPLTSSAGDVLRGVYCIYYTGSDHRLYSGLGRDVPIYVGKADRGGLKGRLDEHRRSIRQVSDLDLKDFSCRFLRINEEWIAGCEKHLQGHFDTLWNGTLTGFGNHAPGKGRDKQAVSLWDTLHTGRPWAARLSMIYQPQDAEALVLKWCSKRGYPPRSRPTRPQKIHIRDLGL